MSELFSSQGMKPFDIGLVMEDAESGGTTAMFLDMFPMEANFGERNEITASFWDVYDSVMNLRLIRVEMDIKSKPEYTLKFVSDGDAEMRVELYSELNIVDISVKEAGADYVKIGRYVIIDRTPEEKYLKGSVRFLRTCQSRYPHERKTQKTVKEKFPPANGM